MNHARVKALKGNKTTSKKAIKSGRASGAMSPRSSPMASLLTSPTHSATPSRVTSDVSDGEDHDDVDLDEMMGSTASVGSGQDGTDDTGSAFDSKALIEELQDHKHNNNEAREHLLESYIRALRTRYSPEAWEWLDQAATPLAETFLRDANRAPTAKERLLNLKAYCLTLGTTEEAEMYENGHKALRQIAADDDDEDVQSYALYALCMTVLYGGGAEEAALELLEWLLDVIQTDGDSIQALDNAVVVVAAFQSWAFVASHVSDYSEHADAAMDAFVDQLNSSDVEVQSNAAMCIALIFESSRSHEQDSGEPFELQYDPHRLVGRIAELARLSAKSVSRKDRRSLRESLNSVVTSLERGVGPFYSTATYIPQRGEYVAPELRMEDGSAEYGYRLKIRTSRQVAKVDSWSLYWRWSTLKLLFKSGLQLHMTYNEVVKECLEDADFEADYGGEDVESGKAAKSRKR